MNNQESVENVISTCAYEYQSPKMEVMEVVVEQGFAATGTDGTGSDFPWG